MHAELTVPVGAKERREGGKGPQDDGRKERKKKKKRRKEARKVRRKEERNVKKGVGAVSLSFLFLSPPLL